MSSSGTQTGVHHLILIITYNLKSEFFALYNTMSRFKNAFCATENTLTQLSGEKWICLKQCYVENANVLYSYYTYL